MKISDPTAVIRMALFAIGGTAIGYSTTSFILYLLR
jgi:hypothetical protein